jgi:hypothetical protein
MLISNLVKKLQKNLKEKVINIKVNECWCFSSFSTVAKSSKTHKFFPLFQWIQIFWSFKHFCKV